MPREDGLEKEDGKAEDNRNKLQKSSRITKKREKNIESDEQFAIDLRDGKLKKIKKEKRFILNGK